MKTNDEKGFKLVHVRKFDERCFNEIIQEKCFICNSPLNGACCSKDVNHSQEGAKEEQRKIDAIKLLHMMEIEDLEDKIKSLEANHKKELEELTKIKDASKEVILEKLQSNYVQVSKDFICYKHNQLNCESPECNPKSSFTLQNKLIEEIRNKERQKRDDDLRELLTVVEYVIEDISADKEVWTEGLNLVIYIRNRLEKKIKEMLGD